MPDIRFDLETRKDKIAALAQFFDFSGMGLELGPDIRPMFRRSDGYNVRYLEARSGDQMRQILEKKGQDPSQVEDIDYILDRSKSLAEHVGDQRFTWVTSAHVVEHIPDFLGHLREVHEVLEPGGVFGLIVPDRNLCFDCLKPPSSLGQVIAMNLTDWRPGAIAAMINEWRYGARPRFHKVGGWSYDEAVRPLVHKHGRWQERVKAAHAAGAAATENFYGHLWQFDPENFGDIVCDLIELEMISFQLEALVPSHRMDFIAVLRKVEVPDLAEARKVARRAARGYRRPSYNPLPIST